MAKRRRLKKSVKVFFILFILVIVGIIYGTKKYNEYLYHQTNEYKLTEVGYTLDESKLLINKLNDENETYFVEHDKDNHIISIIKEKYFLEKNLYDYIDYKINNKKASYSDVIAIVNVHANKDWYDNKTIKETDMSKDNLILVNKFYKLKSDYIPEDLTNINLNYAYDNNKVRKEVNDAFVNMASAAKEENIKLIANSSFRDYDRQDAVYKEFYYSKGIDYADKYAARPGHSEHQTGLCIDIFTGGNSNTENFEESDAYKWLIKNAHKYGFILRYPKDKEYLTGYNYESWHYRYLGIDIATKVYESNLTYDEYYAYYLEK